MIKVTCVYKDGRKPEVSLFPDLNGHGEAYFAYTTTIIQMYKDPELKRGRYMFIASNNSSLEIEAV